MVIGRHANLPALLLAGLGISLAPLASAADAPGPAPEEPAWTGGNPAGSQVPTSNVPQAESAPSPGETASGPNAPEDKPAAPTSEEDLGVPVESRNFLPSFEYEGRGWFERDGLKFRFGPVDVRFSLGAGLEYNDNIFGSNVNPVADYIASIYPVVIAGLGDFQVGEKDFLRLTYSPAINFYYEEKERNQTNQNLQIAAQAEFSRYSTELIVDYMSSDQPNATQTGGQNYSTFAVNWQNRYYLGGKVFAQGTVQAYLQNSENDNNYQTYTFSPQIGYTLSPKTTITAGPYAGIANIGDGASQTFQGLSLTMDYTTLRKLTFSGMVGVQARQFNGFNSTGATNFITPVFNLGAKWQPREYTKISLSLTRDVGISDVQQGLTYTSTSLSAEISQTIWKLQVALNGGYQILEYQGDYPAGRTENFLSGSLSVTYRLFRDTCALTAYYRRQNRTSDVESSDYVQNVYGLRFSYSF